MTQYEKAALLFGTDGTLGEADAIVKYLMFITSLKDDYPNIKPIDEVAIENVLERIGDEINHLLGDTLDAINMAGLKISPDGIDEILEGLRAAVSTDDEQSEQRLIEASYVVDPNTDMINL